MKQISSLHDHSALLLIDVQTGFDDVYWGARNNPAAESNIAKLLQVWREKHRPVIHVRHCSIEANSPLRPDRPGNAYKLEATPIAGEIEFTKSVNSAFIGTGLETYLRQNHIQQLVIAGISTDHCVSTTTRMARNLGFDVLLVADACFSFERRMYDGNMLSAEHIHQANLASLNGEFCTLRITQDFIQ